LLAESSSPIRGAGFWVENAWLRMLLRIGRGYSWVEVDGFRFFGSSRHERLLWRIKKRRYERLTTELFQSALRPGTVALDIGANVGYYAMIAARGVGPNGRVYAFECVPQTSRFLRHNVRANGFTDTVVVVEQAVSDRIGTARLFIRGWDQTESSIWQQDSARGSLEVETTTVDEMLGGDGVDLVKIDVEGGEVRALAGMQRTLDRSGDVTMFVECNPHALAAAGESVTALLDRIAGFGFDVRVIDEAQQALVTADDELLSPALVEDKSFFRNLYCRRAG
jgi:FkbM family methyltransferase